MGSFLFRLKTWWDASERSQKAVLIGSVAFFAVLFGGTFFFASRPRMTMLYGGLSDADKSVIVEQLQSQGIAVKYDVPGTVEVPEDKAQDARMMLAAGGKVPKSAHMGIEGLDKIGLMTTPAQEKERLKAILEGELAKTIETYDTIQAARVHITLGDNSPFVEQRRQATASVSITEASGATVTPDQGRAIATLVAGSVPDLDVKNVSVVNQRMEFVFNGQDADSTKNVAESKIAMEDTVAHNRERELQRTLDSVFGVGSTVVSVRCELDLDKQRSSALTRVPTDPIEKQTVKEEMPMAGGASGAASVDVGNSAANKAGDKYTSQSSSQTRMVSETTTETEKATGAIKSMVINVLGNEDKIKGQDQAKLEDFLRQEVANKGADKLNFPDPKVEWVKFDTSTAVAAAKAGTEATSQARVQQAFSILPIAALIFVAIMVVKSLGKFAKGISQEGGALNYPLALEGDALAGAQNLIAAIDGANEGLARSRTHPDGKPMTKEEEEEAILVESIKNRVHMPLEQLKKMAADRPQVVAMLIKSMILEERR